MPSKEDMEYLRECLKHTSKQEGNYPNGSPFVKKLWWGNEEATARVARILEEHHQLTTPLSVINFFEKPYYWEVNMMKIVSQV